MSKGLFLRPVYILPYALADILGRSHCRAKGNLKSKSNEVRIKIAEVKEMKDDKIRLKTCYVGFRALSVAACPLQS